MRPKSYKGQLGGTKIYALAALLVLFLLGHAGWNYLPVVYQCENFKSELQSATVRVVSMPHGTNERLADKLKKQIRVAGNENGVPQNALIEITEANNSLKARVRFIRDVDLLPFGLYKYHYEFDSTSAV